MKASPCLPAGRSVKQQRNQEQDSTSLLLATAKEPNGRSTGTLIVNHDLNSTSIIKNNHIMETLPHYLQRSRIYYGIGFGWSTHRLNDEKTKNRKTTNA